MILAACPSADQLYTVYESPLTKLGYKSLKVPIPLIRGLGPTLLPRPVKLTHHIAPPLYPPPLDLKNFEQQVDEFHAEIIATMSRLMWQQASALK